MIELNISLISLIKTPKRGEGEGEGEGEGVEGKGKFIRF